MCPEMGVYTLAKDVARMAVHAADYGLHSKIIRKTADEIVNNSTALQDDDELKFTVKANEVWSLEAMLIFESNPTPDYRYAFTVPVGCVILKAPAYDHDAAFYADGEANTAGLVYENNPSILRFGSIIINGANEGVVQLQWAQAVATVFDTKLIKDSFLIAHKLN